MVGLLLRLFFRFFTLGIVFSVHVSMVRWSDGKDLRRPRLDQCMNRQGIDNYINTAINHALPRVNNHIPSALVWQPITSCCWSLRFGSNVSEIFTGRESRDRSNGSSSQKCLAPWSTNSQHGSIDPIPVRHHRPLFHQPMNQLSFRLLHFPSRMV
jgi:hypothetical protein